MRFALAFFLVIALAATLPKARAQSTVSNNILTPTVPAWSGSVAGQNGGYSGGGNGPAFNSTTNTLIFGYTNATATQNISAQAFAIQHALDLANSGIKIQGYNYSWQINNSGQQSGTLTGKVDLLRSGSVLESYTYNYNAPTNGFELKTGTQNFTNEYDMLSTDAIRLSFTGKDSRFWSGYYGPQVRQPSLTLNYTTDPCAANPLYSPSCPNYNKVLTSQNLLGNEYGIQSYAINQALALSGSGVQINGFKYGYDLYVGGDWCYFGFIICFDWRQSSMAVDVNVTSAAGTNLYTATHDHTQQNTFGSYSYSYVFPTKQPLTSMGNFSLSSRQFGTGALYSSWSNWQYTPDPCVVDPLSSATCPGYAVAYKTQQCAANPLYAADCPGYAAAMFTQQCTANVLSDPTCPGYASAYLNYQCSINPLYSTTCAGYETAYFSQQCSINPLYNSRCDGYAVAYKAQQCSLNALYATDCPGYATAYKSQQCSLNALYATDCPGYAAAYKTQQCNSDGLYARDCPNYAEAYAKKNVLNISSTGTTTTTTAPKTTTTVSTTEPTPTVSSSGKVTTDVAIVSDSNVNTVITSKSTSTDAAATSAPVNVTKQESPQQSQQTQPTTTASAPQDKKAEEKKDDAPKGTGGSSSPQNTGNATASSDTKNEPKTARQEIAEKRQEAARAKAVETGKNLANEMGKASNMDQQIAVQNVVIQAMGFTPGFDAYGKTVVPDVIGYKPFTVYNNQKNIDNRANLRMWTGTDNLHNEMVEKQYEGR
jgi:hypothetical protein